MRKRGRNREGERRKEGRKKGRKEERKKERKEGGRKESPGETNMSVTKHLHVIYSIYIMKE